MWPTSAPPVFDIMSFDMAAGLVGILASVASGAWDQRCWEQSCAANFRRISAAVAGCALSIYLLHDLEVGLGGSAGLFSFLFLTLPSAPWTVWFTIGGWILLTAVSVTVVFRSLAALPRKRGQVSHGEPLMQFAVCGASWWQEFVLPLAYFPYYKANPGSLLWYVILTINYALEYSYFLLMVEGACWFALPWLTREYHRGDHVPRVAGRDPIRRFWRW